MLKTLTLFTIILSVAACDMRSCDKEGEHYAINYFNNSDRTIEVIGTSNYPDTTIPDGYDPLNDFGKAILPYTTTDVGHVGPRSDKCVEDAFANGEASWIYFIDHDSIVDLSWDTVRITGRGILERRRVDLKVLQENDFVLTYQE